MMKTMGPRVRLAGVKRDQVKVTAMTREEVIFGLRYAFADVPISQASTGGRSSGFLMAALALLFNPPRLHSKSIFARGNS
uniref:Uncharacterized protein n=1 Tax=Solibacter usitatus (strain Ellin6076) TaxID=234267 RepID=Q022C3_SOLUE